MGGYLLSAVPISRPETRTESLIFIVRGMGLIICKHLRHLRWGQSSSAGPRQKEGAEWAGVGRLTGRVAKRHQVGHRLRGVGELAG